MGLAVTLLQESFSKGKGGHPGRMDAQSPQFSLQGLRVCTWAAEVTCWTDRSRQSDGQTSLRIQAKTKATCMHAGTHHLQKPTHIFFCAYVRWNCFVSCFKAVPSITLSLAYSLGAWVISIRKMETNSISLA